MRQHVAKTDEKYSIAQVLEPLFSNKGLLFAFVPVQLIGFGSLLLRNDYAEVAAVLAAVWYGLFIAACVAISVRWFLRWQAADAARDEVETSRARLAEALAARLRSDPSYFRMLTWTDTADVINEAGDVKLTRTVSIRSGSEPVPMLWSSIESYGPLVSADLVKVSVKQMLNSDGEVDVEHDVVWNNDSGRLMSHVYLYADSPVMPGKEASYKIVWEWPGFYKGLVSGAKREKFDYKLTRECDHMTIVVTLPRMKNHRAHSSPGPLGDTTLGTRRKRPVVTISADNIKRGESVTSTIFLTEID